MHQVLSKSSYLFEGHDWKIWGRSWAYGVYSSTYESLCYYDQWMRNLNYFKNERGHIKSITKCPSYSSANYAAQRHQSIKHFWNGFFLARAVCGVNLWIPGIHKSSLVIQLIGLVFAHPLKGLTRNWQEIQKCWYGLPAGVDYRLQSNTVMFCGSTV